jgi:hypothetical protein
MTLSLRRLMRSRPLGRGGGALRLSGCLLLAAGFWLAAPAPAFAHLSGGTLSTDFEARIEGFRPPSRDISATVLGGDQRLQLRLPAGTVVVVLGLMGEPFLPFSLTGVQANASSPTAWAHLVPQPHGTPPREARWEKVSGGHSFAWHENRLRPVRAVPKASAEPRKVAAWAIPMVINGRRATLVGTEWHAARPSVWPWLAAAARFLSEARRRISRALVPLVAGSLFAG